MSNIVPFDSAVPATRADSPFKITFDGVSKGGASFPVISYKGKVFHIKRGEESVLLTSPDNPDAPAPYIEGVIVGISPGKGLNARTFYNEGYVEGSNASPRCSSHDGVSPDVDAEEPQASKCAVCPMNAVGSGATQQNPKAKACKSHKRIAFAAADALNDPMLIRVPGDSLGALGEFNKLVASRGFPVQEVITRIGFDYSKAHPALTFKPVSVINDGAMIQRIFEATKLDVTQAILGKDSADEGAAEEFETAKVTTAPAPAKAAPAKPADDLPTEKKAKVKVESDAPAKPAPAKKVEQATVVEAGDGIEDALGDLDFDD